jgi:hypothetical protein
VKRLAERFPLLVVAVAMMCQKISGSRLEVRPDRPSEREVLVLEK